MTANRHQPEGDPDEIDPDHEARKEAAQFIVRRTAIWAVPLTLVALLMTALGIPLWISVAATVVLLIVLVFEIDL